MADLEHRPYRRGDEAAINDGFNAVFELNRPLAEWQWKFAAADDALPIMLGVADDGSVMVHYGAVPVRVQVDGRVVNGGQIVDVYTRREARRGLAAARAYLRNYARFVETFCGPDRLAFCYGYPGERVLRLGVMRTFYDDIPPHPVRVLRREASRRARWASRFSVRWGFDGTAADEVWRRSRERYAVAVVRDAEHLRRRYLGRPGVAYDHLTVWRGGAPQALAVLRADEGAVRLADLLWDGRRAGALAAVDRAVTAVARRRQADRIEGWLEADEEAEAVLAGLGWVAGPHPERLHCVVRVFDPEIPWSAVPGRFYMTLGDSDLV